MFTLKTALGGLFALLAAALFTLAWMGDLSKLKDLEADFAKHVSLTYVYADGTQIRVEGDRPGPLIDIKQLPAHVVNAVLAAEDHEFYQHSGYRISSIIAAALQNIRAGRTVRGASTITQQLVKNTYGESEKTLLRKLREIVIADKAERHFRKQYGKRGGKDRILALYVSRIELGSEGGRPVLGFEDAALRYYGRPARQLTLGQSALIAGMLRNWGQLNPLRNYPAAKRRRDLVLRQMLTAGFIDQLAFDAAIARDDTPVEARDRSFNYILDDLRAEIATFARGRKERDDLRIVTTIDREAQQLAASVIAEQLSPYPQANAALIAMSADGAIRTMVGGRDYGVWQFNATRSDALSIGSLLKPFIFLKALEDGADPASQCSDDPFPPDAAWKPNNSYAGGGLPSLATALVRSSNRVPIRLGEELGRERVVRLLRSVGFDERNVPTDRTWVLTSRGSPIDIATAFLTLSNDGWRVSPRLFDTITTEDGRQVASANPARISAGIPAEPLSQVRAMLRQVVVQGTGKAAGAGLAIPLAGKTGTTDGNRAGWFVGFGEGFAVAVWVGWTGKGEGPPAVSGPNLPSRIFNNFMKRQGAAWVRPLQGGEVPAETDPVQADFSTGRAPAGFGCTPIRGAGSTSELDRSAKTAN